MAKRRAIPAPLAPGKKTRRFRKRKGKAAAVQTPPDAHSDDVEAAAAGAKEKGAGRRMAGYIFMCSGKTKPECYQYRVFGLPKGRLDVVERIRKGTKLFLYDFDLKLLYGVYKATSKGGLNLEAAAFNGKFPSQVKFRIVNDCLPLPEGSLKYAIQENYNRGKFDPELNFEQVQRLLSLFRPISPTQYSSFPHVVEERHHLPTDERYRLGGLPYAPPPVDLRFAPPVIPHLANYPNDPAAQIPLAPPVMDPHHIPSARLPPLTGVYHSSAAGLPPSQDAYRQSVAVTGLPPPREAYYQPATGLLPPRDVYYQPFTSLPTAGDAYHQPATGWAPAKPTPGDTYYQPATELPPANDPYYPATVPGNQLDSQAYNPENPLLPENFGALQQMISREQPPAPPSRDYRSLTAREGEMASRVELTPQQRQWALGYSDSSRAYAASLRGPISSGTNMPNLSVSSVYSLAGAAPAGR